MTKQEAEAFLARNPKTLKMVAHLQSPKSVFDSLYAFGEIDGGEDDSKVNLVDVAKAIGT